MVRLLQMTNGRRLAPSLITAVKMGLALVGPALRRTGGGSIGGNPCQRHAGPVKQNASTSLQWIEDRFAGKPAPSDCGQI